MDYGKYVYEQKKKEKEIKAKSHKTETKSIQIKVVTSPHDLELKAKKTSEWLREGHRIKIDLFLRGRSKYLDKAFLHERIDRFLKLLTEQYKMADEPRQSPKGITFVIERV